MLFDLKVFVCGMYNKCFRSDYGGDVFWYGKVGGRGFGFISYYRSSVGGGAFGGGCGGVVRFVLSVDFIVVLLLL